MNLHLRDRDVDADEAEKELRNKIDELLEQNAEAAPLYLEAGEKWENFKDWLVEDIFQRTYQDMMPDSRDAVALYQNDPHSPQWVRGMMVDASAQEIKPSHKNLDSAEQQDFRNEVERTVFEALDKAQVAYEDFTPEQMDVIYAVAENGGSLEELLNPEFSPEQMQLIADVQTRTDAIHRSAADDAVKPLTSKPMTPEEVNQARKEKNLPLDTDTAQKPLAQPKQEPINFHITDNDLGAGGAKTKFKANIEAIRLLQTLDAEQRQATAEEQEVLSRYVGWGGIPQAFDEKNADWSKEYAELKSLLPAGEYSEARASTLNAFYTSPTVIKAMYEALSNMGLSKGNVLEPSCGVGNFMGLVPESMENIKMYGVELDSVSGRIAQQLYQKNKIAVQGFETMQFPDSFFDCVVGNVPFGNYKVPDKRYDRHNFLIHDYFIAKSLDLVRPGGVVAVVTSSGTMDKKDSSVREYLANRADLVGAIRLPNNAFQRNANTSVVADILFLQKRDRAAVERAEWVDLGTTPEGYPINQYFAQHPEMVLGEITTESTQYGKQETTVKPIEGADLAQQLKAAVENIHAEITEPEITDDELDQNAEPLPADPNVKNFSYTNVDGQVYYRENSYMNKVDLPAVTAERVLGMIALRETTQKLLDCQLHDGTDTTSVRTLPEDKWIIAENAHEAIVTKDEYYQAQKAIRNVTPIQYKVGDDFALKGKICCGNCNRQLRHERQYGEMVFYCGYKRSAGKFSKCYGGYYREYSVNAKVARAIKTVFYALDVVNQGMQEKQSITVRCMDIEDLEKQAEAIRVEQIKLYESYADGVLLRDAYIEKKKALSEKLAALQDSIRTEKEEQECADELDEEIRALTKQASEKTYIGGLTKECVDAFVSMVYLYDDQTMKIEFNCEDVIRRALEKYGA